jgi:hypothetical protein
VIRISIALRAVILSLLFVASSAYADSTDIDLSSLGEIGIPGGVDHSAIRDQKSGDICWSYTLAAMAEASYRKKLIDQALARNPSLDRKALEADKRHRTTHVSPEYLAFWHIYNQIQTHLTYFGRLARALVDKPESKVAKNAREAYGLLKSRNPNTKKDFQPDIGAVESDSLKEAAIFGMVPDRWFENRTADGKDLAITSEKQETSLERAIPDFVGEYVLKLRNIERYKKVGKDGIRMALYNDMNKYFRKVMGMERIGPHAKFPLPTDPITYNSKTYTPIEFMSYLDFNPNDYVAYISDSNNQQLALQAMKASLDQDYLTPIGIAIFDDDTPSNDPFNTASVDLQKRAQESGVFTTDFCPDKKCTNDSGGHEISAVNYFHDGDTVTALVIKNSWGAIGGRNVDGQLLSPGESKSDQGYFIVTAEYLRQTSDNVNDAWDFVLPKAIADLPQFKDQFTAE